MNVKTKYKGIRLMIPVLILGAILLSACSLTAAQDPPSIPEATIPAPDVDEDLPDQDTTASEPDPLVNPGTTVTYGMLTAVIPAAVADGASGTEVPPYDSEDAAWFQKTPGHWQVMLGDYYVLEDTFHQPQIYVYPAQGYAEMVPSAFESIHRINNILYDPSAIDPDQLPGVPFFNAQAVFVSNIEVISFQNGKGVRFLTEYGQYPAPANNHELFYHFQGVTSDGAYYIIAILPVNAPDLAENSEAAAALPIGGIAYPDMSDSNADWDGYYAAVTDLLNATPADSFTPALGQLDALINSIVISSP